MRIIGGKFGRRRVDTPKGMECRPTTDKAKESLFNILQNRIDFDDMKALDLFSGTGSIAYELVSRGCSKVIGVEKNKAQLTFMHQVRSQFDMPELIIRKADALRFVEQYSGSFDFIFIDPPYSYPDYEKLLETIFERGLLKENGTLVIEHDTRHDFSKNPRFEEHRSYSKVNFTFFE